MLNKKFNFSYFLTFVSILIFLTYWNFFYQNLLGARVKILSFKVKISFFENGFLLLLFTTVFFIFFLKKNFILNFNINFICLVLTSIILSFVVYTDSIFFFFFNYEVLLLLSAVIFKYSSQNKRSKKIFIYFVSWTQLSSLLLWLGVVQIWLFSQTLNFSFLYYNFLNNDLNNYLIYLLVIAFSIKLPLWPFSFWLLKVHVEANTAFSIFLSGILVKVALIGLLKVQPLFFFININFFIFFTLLSILILSLSLHHQVDLKKFIAATTIQEMSLILFFLFFNGLVNTNLIYYFIWLHTITSFLLFLITDLIYTRFKIRKTNSLLSLAILTPKLNLFIFFIWLLFVGFPISIKFLIEFIFLSKIKSLSIFILFIFVVALQFFTNIIFTKQFLSLSFGFSKQFVFDINFYEFFFFFNFLLILLILLV